MEGGGSAAYHTLTRVTLATLLRMPRPIVALSATSRPTEGQSRVRLNEAYVSAARGCGLVPIVVPPLAPEELASILGSVQGIILTGGEDVDPAEYGEPPHPRTQRPHTARDKCELAMARAARELGLPTLAICRGIQVVNVAFGGTLIQDIPSEAPSDVQHDQEDEREARVHDVAIEPGSRLAAALGASAVTVNSFHHQAVEQLAPGLRVTATAPDGIVEGLEWAGEDWWMLAVQWHPEELVRDARDWDRGLFRAFAAAL